ncbi:hypothetical protein COS75_00710 [Candidatus Pacearchaeota archaeon CG06_land_8_20_14_3_00_35_12]|nr:MAG: hypothetical protein COS75_00710 [Candidatus Pacearchaeota archaeon CG06_land_8_20_14_3_00_35_12]
MRKGVKKDILILAVIIAVVIAISVFGKIYFPEPENNSNMNNSTSNAGIANPASVYCIQQGGNLSIRSDASGNQYGVCVFNNGSECDEWKFFRGEEC